ncbi:MAG: SynChlorMet cassette protein ScmC [Deltaproteobacteria bacterium]|nr:SynChlorMet cassette protein ScmC [Deltaproteobacteria bacterium]
MYFTLANGTTWRLSAHDPPSRASLARLAAAMQLKPSPPPGMMEQALAVEIRDRGSADEDDPALPLFRLSARFAASALDGDGLLVHAALAERAGRGVILAGPGGSGKSTASGRLPVPWRSLSDDQALVVRDRGGRCWAHPWPTWSRFLWGGPGGTWDVERAVPLQAIFFLDRAPADGVRRIGQGEAACLAIAVVEQAAMNHLLVDSGLDPKRLRLQRFALIDALVKQVPCYVLQASLTGSFWSLLDAVLDGLQSDPR